MSNLILNIEGNWKMSISGDGDNKSAICTLIQEGNALTGTFRGPMGNLPLAGTLTNDGNLSFTAKFIMGNLKFSGTVDGEMMNGFVDFPIGKGRKSWTGIKLIDEHNL